MMRHVVLRAIIGKEGLYPSDYHLRRGFCKLAFRKWFCCCYARLEADKDFVGKSTTLKACNMLIDEKLNLKNFLHDAMDFHAVRQLMVKSRHKILMPTLVLHLTKTKLNQGGEYKSSFARNLHERTDRPVFTIEDAVNQVKTNDGSKTQVEIAMDDFFVSHLPQEIIEQAGDYQNHELDQD